VPPALILPLILAAAPALAEPDFPALTAKQEGQAVADRRWLHEHAELSLRERETQAYLRRALQAIPGVELVEGDWGTGVVALLRGGKSGPVVAWRTDMDGLPISENTDLPFACTRMDTLDGGKPTGVMHACGHDLHMAVALGMVRMLAEVRRQMPGTLLWIGEPAEEIGAGANQLIEAGLFDEGRRPRCALALHVNSNYPVGQVGSCPGGATANVDGFVLTVKGAGGHGAYPHKAVDPITLAAQMVLAFPAIIAREMDVVHHAVISVGRIEGGSKSNVIPDEVVMEATVRSLDEETRLALREKITRTVMGLAQAAGAPAPELEYYLGTPAGYNDPALVDQCREVFRRVVGPGNEFVYEPAMGGEDFSFFGREVPSFQFRLGVLPDRSPEMSTHTAEFNPDEGAIAVGMRLAAELVWDQLRREE
jgi:amidohydrolase